MKLSKFVAAFFLLSSQNSFAEKTSEELSSTCLGCHGVVSYNNIYPTYKVPKLGNQHKDYIITALKAYRSGERSHPTMKAHAANLNDEEIAKIADYFSSLKTENQNLPSINLEMIDDANSCVGCHGVDGNSIVPTFPKIAGQYEDYLYQALKSYQDGTRNNAIMNGIASTLNEKQMRKLSKYFASHNGLGKINQGRVALKK